MGFFAKKGILAGAMISIGAMFSMSVAQYGPLAQGICFSLGLFGVICCKGSLFTGNVAKVSWVWDGDAAYDEVYSLWIHSWWMNLLGAFCVALMASRIGFDANFAAQTKAATEPIEIFVRAILCNVLVCFAVGVSNSAINVVDVLAACILPVACFVACGFEHSIADMFYMVLGMLNGAVEFGDAFRVVMFATAGNIIGGLLITSLAYEGKIDEEKPE